MVQTQLNCPQCHAPMVANVQQVFDLSQDPMAKDRLLNGRVNLAVCDSCGYAAPLGLPMVYHDPEKELLLTYFPSEMGLPVEEQEKALGPLIQQVVDRLPMESRKAYLLRPQSMLTFETLIEKILEADGITKEMLQEQEKKMGLLRRLMTCEESSLSEIIQQETSLLDQAFFALFSNVQTAAVQTQDATTLERLKKIQDILLTETDYGKTLKKRAESTNQALLDLQELGESLNQDSLVDLVLNSPDDAYLQTIAGLARNGMDYTFFTKLTEKINGANPEKKVAYEQIRDQLLTIIKQIDEAVAEQAALRKKIFDAILAAPNQDEAIASYGQGIDDTFMQIAHTELENARKAGDFVRSGKIQTLIEKIEELQKIPAEIEFLELLLLKEKPDEIAAELAANSEKVTDEFKNTLNGLVDQLAKLPEQHELAEKLKLIQSLV